MAKAGMRRPDPYDPKNHGTENHQPMHHPKNEQAQVPEIQGAAKNGNAKAGPVKATAPGTGWPLDRPLRSCGQAEFCSLSLSDCL